IRVAFVTSFGETIFDDQVLTLDVAEFPQPRQETLDRPQRQTAHQPDTLHPRRLLRTRRERPRRRAAEQRDERAPVAHSITSSASESNLPGTVRRSVLAVVRLITRSNLVGCSTGMPAGLVPQNILSMSSAPRRYKSS